ncbi:hypothetical protein XELAEV_18025508mg [Xenopus laevis]|uniref:Fibronectin type-III domain-containing protein n=1 Tax=Xenopus laevis TaxID=8355 RepID=A0A974CZV8_XENLA|nr:hypothetical protein XELAEV_18025508mg [Xenopus laevis]
MQYSCNDNNAELSWKASLGALGYTATVSTQDMENVNCSTREIYCIVDGIKCGQIYTMTVETFVPCQPQNVTAKIDCTSSVVSVSWDIAPGALRYSAILKASGGEKLMCNSTELGCQVKNLQCGQIYAVTVTAFNEWCQSASSSPIELVSGEELALCIYNI